VKFYHHGKYEKKHNNVGINNNKLSDSSDCNYKDNILVVYDGDDDGSYMLMNVHKMVNEYEIPYVSDVDDDIKLSGWKKYKFIY
jgi:hypothetical protein